jgi:hypothetical protein
MNSLFPLLILVNKKHFSIQYFNVMHILCVILKGQPFKSNFFPPFLCTRHPNIGNHLYGGHDHTFMRIFCFEEWIFQLAIRNKNFNAQLQTV